MYICTKNSSQTVLNIIYDSYLVFIYSMILVYLSINKLLLGVIDLWYVVFIYVCFISFCVVIDLIYFPYYLFKLFVIIQQILKNEIPHVDEEKNRASSVRVLVKFRWISNLHFMLIGIIKATKKIYGSFRPTLQHMVNVFSI